MSLYLPSGSNLARIAHKFKFMDDFLEYITQLKEAIPNLVICGDYNICHEAIDIHDPVRNKNVSGFLPEERDWLSRFIQSGFIDSFRFFNKEPHHYTWWSYRANSRANNKGWRIDYITVTEPLKKQLLDADIFGPSIPKMFGAESERPAGIKIDDREMINPLEKFGVKFLSVGFFVDTESAIIWRGPNE